MALDNTLNGGQEAAVVGGASRLGQLVGIGVLDSDDVVHRLQSTIGHHVANRAFTWTEAHRSIQSGLNKGIRQPRRLPQHRTRT